MYLITKKTEIPAYQTYKFEFLVDYNLTPEFTTDYRDGKEYASEKEAQQVIDESQELKQQKCFVKKF